MKIYVMRHGQAQFYADSDSQRPLSEMGIHQAKSMGIWLNKQCKTPIQQVWVSPYLRAQQTLNALKEHIQIQEPIKILEDLTPHGDEFDVINYLNALLQANPIESLLIVSHLPLVGYLTHSLTKSNEIPMFSTASMAAIDYDVDTKMGHLSWFKNVSELA